MTPEQEGQIRQFKILEERLLRLLDDIEDGIPTWDEKGEPDGYIPVNPLWLDAGRLELESAFMKITRAIAKPERFDLDNEDAAHA